jgi:RNA polymerase sigma-70 factor (ECF subfamily)
MNLPDTRPCLLLRVRDANDADAWDEFAGICQPVIIRLARIKGMQAADADDLSQQVLSAGCVKQTPSHQAKRMSR